MTLREKGEIEWGIIGKPLEELLQYERKTGQHGTGYDLISTVVDAPSGSPWRRFLLEGETFGAVVRQVIAISRSDGTTPVSAIDSIRELVERASARSPRTASSFLGAYLKERPSFPSQVRDTLDDLARAGKRAIPLHAAALASERARLQPNGAPGSGEQQVLGHWYEEIIRGRVTAPQARKVPAHVLAARDRLLDHLRDGKDDHIDENTVYTRYSRLFKSKDIPAMVDIVIGIHRIGLELDVDQIELFLENYSKDEAMRRFASLREWMIRANAWTNLDGVILTPKLISFLSQKADFESLLGELDRYREETRNGRFKIDNEIQRELEFKRFVSASRSSFVHPSTFPRWTLLDPVPEPADLPRLFSELEELPPPEEEEYVPNKQDLIEVKRAAFEAALFLQMLREFRARTSRPIMVVGNDRYGRQWVVEPIEEHLDDGFTIRFARVNSGASMRLTVASPFPREIVRDLSERMPHIVIVDGANWPRRNTYSRPERLYNVMRCSRAMRGYANWLVAFNDIRAEGDASKYQQESSLPEDHISELRKWYGFSTVRQELREWVNPGQTYRVTTWGPELWETVLLGDIDVARQHVELGGNRPLAVLANTTIYHEKGEEIASALKGTTVHYFDEPNRRVKETVLFGFGSHGFETRVKGPTTASFVAVMQRHIKTEIGRLAKNPSELSFPR